MPKSPKDCGQRAPSLAFHAVRRTREEFGAPNDPLHCCNLYAPWEGPRGRFWRNPTNVKTRIILPILSLSLLAIGCGSKGGPTATVGGSDVVAIVNKEPITAAEFNEYLPRKSTVQVITPQGATEVKVAGSLGIQALRDLVNKKLLLQLATDSGVAPTQADIEQELKFQTARDPNFTRRLTTAGLNLEQIKADLQVAIASRKVITKGITVTPKEVDDYIKQNPKAFETPARVELSWIVLMDKKNKAAVDQDLKGGSSFGQVASRYSEAPNARTTMGAYPEQVVDRLPAKLQPIVAKLNAGGSTDWIADGPQNIVKFYLQSRTPAGKLKIDDTLKESVKRLLEEQRGSQARDLNKTLSDRLRTAEIDVKLNWLRDPWKQAIDNLKGSAERTAPGAGTAGAPEAAPTAPGQTK
ncbi:hypothetical protein EON81_08200 [bacterium]|nr:MAG: hypothetical protein EON81_08200 [bacterium]